MKTSNIYFGRGFVESRKSIRVIAHIGEESESDNPTTTLLRWSGNGQQWSQFKLPWIGIGIGVVFSPAPLVLVANGDGTVGRGYGTFSTEEIDPSPAGPVGRGPLRDLRIINDTPYLVGMSRQVYRRQNSGKWQHIDDGAVAPIGQVSVSGFNSIDGRTDGELWAVGFGGEIWKFSNAKWCQVESPTNLVLHRILAIRPNLIYASGQNGILLVYEGIGWREIYHDATENDIWGLEWFENSLYASSETQIFRLERDNLLTVEVPDATTFGHLHSRDGVMWSFGTEHLVWTENGHEWNNATPRI